MHSLLGSLIRGVWRWVGHADLPPALAGEHDWLRPFRDVDGLGLVVTVALGVGLRRLDSLFKLQLFLSHAIMLSPAGPC